MDLRREFVLRAVEPGANIAALCREFGVSRKSGYKWLRRFQERGVGGLDDLSRRPARFAKAVSGEVVLRVLELQKRHPRWGAKKLRQLLIRAKLDIPIPNARTIARILDRAGIPRIRRSTRRQRALRSTAFVKPIADRPNALWTVDFKGWWRVGNGCRAEPLTVRDDFSRKILLSKILRANDSRCVQREFEQLFNRYGLPEVIQSDNGPPFATTNAPHALTRLAAWWISVGIHLVRGRPAHPQDNGGHERMHLDLQIDVAAGRRTETLRQQQVELDRWVEEFNAIRPHEALQMKTPNELYQRSLRPYRGSLRPTYPANYAVRLVGTNGMVCICSRRYFVGIALAGWEIGLERIEDDCYRVFFYDVDVGTITKGTRVTRYKPETVTAGN